MNTLPVFQAMSRVFFSGFFLVASFMAFAETTSAGLPRPPTSTTVGDQDPKADSSLPEFHLRKGLGNVFAKIQKGEPVRVAFLGGSITAAPGWRVHTLAWLRSSYPQVAFEEIFAAVSGTGSDYGAMRFERDVLRHNPDLVFVEFAVNDGKGSVGVEAQMEGIVRQAWVRNPRIDLCFVYTVNVALIGDLLNGEYQSPARSMEAIAEHYGIPSFNFGVEITRRVRAGTLVMAPEQGELSDDSGNDPKGRLIFTLDKTHPTPSGHRVYSERICRALPQMLQAGVSAPHPLTAPRRQDHWQAARIVTVEETTPDSSWRPVPSDDIHVTTQMFPSLVPATLCAFNSGAVIEFRFRGRILGLVGLKGPENGRFQVTVDDLPPVTGTLFDRNSRPGRFFLSRWIYPKTLADTEHRVRLELLPTRIDKAGIMAEAGTPIVDAKVFDPHGLYFSGFLIVGEPINSRVK